MVVYCVAYICSLLVLVICAMKIIDKLNDLLASKEQTPFFSFEYFPPKTEAGVGNL